jgi:HSP20 family protein
MGVDPLVTQNILSCIFKGLHGSHGSALTNPLLGSFHDVSNNPLLSELYQIPELLKLCCDKTSFDPVFKLGVEHVMKHPIFATLCPFLLSPGVIEHLPPWIVSQIMTLVSGNTVGGGTTGFEHAGITPLNLMDRNWWKIQGQPINQQSLLQRPWYPRADVIDKGDLYKVKVELPGIKADEVSVTYRNNVLIICPSKPVTKVVEETMKAGLILINEGHIGWFQRSIPIPEPVDAKKITAITKNGILKVFLPKPSDVDIRVGGGGRSESQKGHGQQQHKQQQ